MKRNIFFSILCISFFLSTTIFAADIVPLRISAKENYDRIVFGWSKTVSYTLNNKAGLLTVKFNAPATIEKSVKKVENIGEHKIISNEPLEVSFQIPKSSKVRDFKIGNRVVFDIHDPKNPEDRIKSKAPTSTPEIVDKPKESQKKPVPKEVVTKKAEEVKKVEKKQITKQNIKEPPAAPPAFVLVPERLPAKKKQAEPKKGKIENDKQKSGLRQAVKQENHVVSIRSTSNMGLASFIIHDEIWFVMDNDASLVVPNLNSKSPEIFGELYPVTVPESNAYRIKYPKDKGFEFKGQGAGLTWDMIMGDKVKPNVAPEPIYKSGTALLFPLYGAAEILETEHPETGEKLIIVTTEEVRQSGSYKQVFAEFETLHSPIGLALLPKVDDLKVIKNDRGILVTRPQGLSLSSASQRNAAKIFKKQIEDKADSKDPSKGKEQKKKKNLYNFYKWKIGKAKEISKNKSALMEGFDQKSESKRVEDLITLGKMMLSHGLASEALGYFEFAAIELPAIAESAEFKALRGAALALDWKSEDALADLLHKSVKKEPEVRYWSAYALADLGDWQQAASIIPPEYKPIYDYPDYIAHELALRLAEVNLRAGKVNQAKELLSLVESTDKKITTPHKAALNYLKGEAYRQQGETDKTKDLWKKLVESEDDLFATRANLALTILESKKDKISTEEVIDRLESIRYAWRGDDLEAQIKYWLGKAYFDKDEFIVGLSIMRDAASIAGQTALARKIASDMVKTYANLYLGPKLKEVDALEALAVFEQFRELTPIGDEGNKLEQNLAEHLVKSNLFERAAKMLRHQVDHRLNGEEKLNISMRLAEIELIDKNPQKTINALVKASEALRTLKNYPNKQERQTEIELLRIQAYKQNKEFDKSLNLLEKLSPNQTVNKLKADVAWKAGYWEEAAKQLNAVIIDEEITPDTELNEEQAGLILNRAIALNLSSQKIALANIRAKYSSLMEATNKANEFELITRAKRQVSTDDREALLATVSEVEIFKDFLESYKNK